MYFQLAFPRQGVSQVFVVDNGEVDYFTSLQNFFDAQDSTK